MPWGVLDEKFRLRNGECTILAGINSSGKESIIGSDFTERYGAGREVPVCVTRNEPTQSANTHVQASQRFCKTNRGLYVGVRKVESGQALLL